MFPWLVLGEEMEVVRSHPHRDHRTSRTRCVWGNTVVPELPFPPQRARPFHSHSIQTQASPFYLSRGVIRSITLVFWVGHLFRPFFIVWCVDCLFCRIPGPIQIQSFFVTGTGSHPDSFHYHRVPDSFQLPLVMDSWKFVLEIHWTWSELHWSLFDIGRVFWEDRYWEIFLGFARSCTKPPSLYGTTWDSRRAYLSFLYEGSCSSFVGLT